MADLTDAERSALERLEGRLNTHRVWLAEVDAYYRAEQRIADLGISTPEKLRGLHTVLGWARVAVDSIEERLDVTGFIYPDQPGLDDTLQEIWQANNLDEESQLAHLDALVFGHSYILVGANAKNEPVITVESPLNVAVEYDALTRQVSEALQVYGEKCNAAVLYLPNVFVTLARAERHAAWQVVDRVANPLGRVPVVRMANRQRTHDRVGRSEITTDIRSITDSACRTLLGLEVSREFFASPQRYILGLEEESFEDADGNRIDLQATYTGRMMVFPKNSEDEDPKVGTFEAGDPRTYTEIIEMYAKIMVSLTGLPPQYLGVTEQQPPTAESIRMQESRLVKKAERRQRAFSGAWEEAMRHALAIRDGGRYAEDAQRIQTMWVDPATPTLAAQADAAVKLVSAGIIPARSDVTLERVGFTTGEIARIEADWARQNNSDQLAALASLAQGQVNGAIGNGAAPGGPGRPSNPAPAANS